MSEPIVTPEPSAEPTPQPQPKTSPTPEPSPVPPTWRDGFETSDYKENDNFKKYKSLDDMGKAHLELVKMIGKKGVVLPDEKDVNDLNRFYKELGRPDEASQYIVPEIEVEDDFKSFLSEDKFNKFKDIAHRHGLSQKQFEGIAKEFTNQQLEEVKSIVYQENKKLEDSTRDLMNEWVIDYDANSKLAADALRSFGKGIPQEKLDILINDPDIKRLGFNIAKSVSEDSYVKGGGHNIETIQSLQSFIDSQVNTSGSSFYNQKAPDHKATKQKVEDAYNKLAALRKGAA